MSLLHILSRFQTLQLLSFVFTIIYCINYFFFHCVRLASLTVAFCLIVSNVSHSIGCNDQVVSGIFAVILRNINFRLV